MAYIYLEELKKILPEILDQWIDGDDESWEWIFQEIEQKCHVGKKSKKKKKVSKIDAIEIAIMAHRNDINECNRKITNLSDVYTGKVQQMQLTINDLRAEVMHLRSEITAAKSMAETAKQRTEVDYSKYSGKSDGEIHYGKDCEKMCKTCKHSSNIDGSPRSFDAPPCDSCNHNNKWEAKENDGSRSYNECVSCKYMLKEPSEQPCVGCRYNGINNSGIDKWEAKDE